MSTDDLLAANPHALKNAGQHGPTWKGALLSSQEKIARRAKYRTKPPVQDAAEFKRQMLKVPLIDDDKRPGSAGRKEIPPGKRFLDDVLLVAMLIDLERHGKSNAEALDETARSSKKRYGRSISRKSVERAAYESRDIPGGTMKAWLEMLPEGEFRAFIADDQEPIS